MMVMLGLLGSSYCFVFKPAAEKRVAREADIMSKKKALADLKLATAGISDLERKILELQEAIRFFEKKLPAQKEIDNILKEVWQMAEANSLQTRTIKTMKSERAAGYSEQPIQMSLAGDFSGFYAYLLQLEKLPRITRLTQMKLEKIPNRDGEMQAQMTLSIFFEPDSGAGLAKAE
jgi:type IV pilus assembly protein PilO